LTLRLFNNTVYSADFNNIELDDHRFGVEMFVAYFKVDLFHSPAVKKGIQAYSQPEYFN
jgi:hypothetical protein